MGNEISLEASPMYSNGLMMMMIQSFTTYCSARSCSYGRREMKPRLPIEFVILSIKQHSIWPEKVDILTCVVALESSRPGMLSREIGDQQRRGKGRSCPRSVLFDVLS